MTMKIVTHEDNQVIDWAALASLLARGGLNQRPLHQIQLAWSNSSFCWYGYSDGKLIATARAISDYCWVSYLADVVVDPDYQGKGYGRQLMNQIMQTLLPYGKIFIYAVPDKVEFYQHHNFRLLTTGMVGADDKTLISLHQKGYII